MAHLLDFSVGMEGWGLSGCGKSQSHVKMPQRDDSKRLAWFHSLGDGYWSDRCFPTSVSTSFWSDPCVLEKKM